MPDPFRTTAPPLKALWLRFFKTRSQSDRNLLWLAYCDSDLPQRVVGKLLGGRVHGGDQHFMTIDGLIPAAKIRLATAIEEYDPGQGVVPETFLSNVMRWAVLNDMRAHDIVSRKDRAKIKAGKMREPVVNTLGSVGKGEDQAELKDSQVWAPDEIALARERLRATFRFVPREMRGPVVLRVLGSLSLRDIWAIKQSRLGKRATYPPGAFKQRMKRALASWERAWDDIHCPTANSSDNGERIT